MAKCLYRQNTDAKDWILVNFHDRKVCHFSSAEGCPGKAAKGQKLAGTVTARIGARVITRLGPCREAGSWRELQGRSVRLPSSG